MRRGKISIQFLWLMVGMLAACSTAPSLPPWVLSIKNPPGYYRAVGFGEGPDVAGAVRQARQNAVMQIVESSFGESLRYDYSQKTQRTSLKRSSSVDDFFRSASSGTLFGQRVVHNEVSHAGKGYVAYVQVEVSKKNVRKAYADFLEKKKAREELLLSETRGAVFLETRHYRRALRYYRRMVRKNPDSDVWWVGVGASLYRLGQYQAALEATDKALLRNPRSFYGYWNRSSILRHLGQNRAAVASLQRACQLSPSRACSLRLEMERRMDR